jgi:hypothetical protein
MNSKQKERYDLRLAQYQAIQDVTPGMAAIIWTLACVEMEEEMLQEFVNEQGTVYQVVGKSGDIYSRARPEWQQLKEARMRKQALVARIENQMKGYDQKESEDVETYFG